MLTRQSTSRRSSTTPSSGSRRCRGAIPAFVARGDLEAARRELGALREAAERTAQPFMLHVAEHYGVDHRALRRAGSTRPRPGRAARTNGAGSSRDAIADGRLRHPDVHRPARAGPPRGARAGDPDPRRRTGSARAPGAPGSSSAARRARHGGRGPARARARRGERAGPVPPVAVAGRPDLPDRRLCRARRRGDRGPRLSGARPAGRRERDDRPPRHLPRRRRPLPRHARRHARRVGARGGGTSSARSSSTAARACAPGSPTPRTSTAAVCWRRGPGDRERGRALLGEAAALAEGDRHAVAARPRPGARRRRARGRGRPTGCRPARPRSSPSSPAA